VEGKSANVILDEWVRLRIASEAGVLLNDAIRDLLIPQHLNAEAAQYHDRGLVTESYAGAWMRVAVMSVVMALYRLHQVRNGFLLRWLFTDSELRSLGFGPVEEFVQDWKSFTIVRSQYVGHAKSKRTVGERPARLVSARALATALCRTGLWDRDNFLLRVREQVVPGAEKVRDEIFQRYPQAREFAISAYGDEIVRTIRKMGFEAE
jgi:hypothetical protein